MGKLKCNEKGYMVIEAVLVYPVIIIAITAFLYILFLFGLRAQLMAAGQSSIIYIQSFCMSAKGNQEIALPSDNENVKGNGVEYNVYSSWLGDAFGFAGIDSRFNSLTSNDCENVKKIFFYYLKSPLIGSNDDISVSCTTTNYAVVKNVTLNVEYQKRLPFSFAYIGMEELDNIKLSMEFSAPIQDSVETVRNLQFVEYVLHKTGVDEKIDNIVSKVKNFFKKDKQGE